MRNQAEVAKEDIIIPIPNTRLDMKATLLQPNSATSGPQRQPKMPEKTRERLKIVAVSNDEVPILFSSREKIIPKQVHGMADTN